MDNLDKSAFTETDLLNAIPDPVFVQSMDHTVIKANLAFIRGLNLELKEVIGKKCHNLFHGTNEPWPGCPFEITRLDNKPHTLEVNDPRTGIPLLITTSPVHNDRGETVAIVHISKDISDLKKAEKVKAEFTSTVSHELRTPLTAIKESINIVLDGTAGAITEEQKDFLSMSKRNVDRLARLINDVLDFQKLESGKMTFSFEENDINEVVEETRQAMSSVAKTKGLELGLGLDSTLPRVKFDKDKITQVMANLVSNAIKFTDKGSVKIFTSREEGFVMVSVRDTGPGIRKEDMPKLFQQFAQLENGLTRKTGGTGLGLAISREIVMRHNGKIWAESEYGKGASFNFTLPVG